MVDPADLSLDHPPVLLDVRWRLSGPPGREDYDAGHLPGAVFIDLDTELSGTPGRGGRHPLPDPAALERTLRAKGVREGDSVVVYDAGDDQAAARAWWILRWAGHRDTRVLDGGYAAWVAAGARYQHKSHKPGTATSPYAPAVCRCSTPTPPPNARRTACSSTPAWRRATGARSSRSTRSPATSRAPSTCRPPTSRRRTAACVPRPSCASGSRRSRDREVGAYCGSGVTAAHTVLALHRAGRTDAALYVGSWSEWVADPGRPVATMEG